METLSHGSQLPVNSNYSNVLLHVGVNRILPSPYQHRKYFNEDRLRELAASIQREGLIQPIVVRPVNGGYELIAGERRLRAVRDYTGMDKIVCSIVEVDDLQARRMSAAENLQREDLSAMETIEAIVEVIDAELIEDRDYAAMGATPLDRVKIVLRKIDSDRRSTERGFSSKNVTKERSNKFIRRIEMIFSNLPKPLEWQSFFKNDLPLLRDFCQDVRDVSDRHHLNRSQIRALIKLKTSSDEAFQEIIGNTKKATPPDRSPGRDRNKSNVYPFPSDVTIGDLSAREIEEVADKITQKEIRTERNRPRISPSFNLSTTILLMTRLGITVDRIALQAKPIERIQQIKPIQPTEPIRQEPLACQ